MFERASALRPEDYQAPGSSRRLRVAGNVDERDAAHRRALKLMEDRLELNPDDARACNLGAAIHRQAWRTDQGRRISRRGRSRSIPKIRCCSTTSRALTSCSARYEDAMNCLERAVDKGFGHKEWIDHDSDLDSVARQPEIPGDHRRRCDADAPSSRAPRSALSQTYTIDRELGRGGMATVYLAQDVQARAARRAQGSASRARRSLGPDRFLREIKLAARLNHPHILPLHDSGEADGFLYYVMPYVEGESLRERLDREHQLPVEEAVHHARAIASALDYAHRQGIVHRDIKPENVMLYEGEAMVMDFGIAKAVSAAGSDTLTQTGMMIGTPAYVSPEQAAGETNLDGRSDQYSLACMLYEMLSGERAFSGPTAQAVMAKRFTETAKPVRSMRSSIPETWSARSRKAMSTDTGCALQDGGAVRAGARVRQRRDTHRHGDTSADRRSRRRSRSPCCRSRT